MQSGHADADRLAMTGGSYGGAPTLVAAMLDDRVTCGGAPVPSELGSDPCEGVDDGDLAPWTTPDGSTRLRLAAAVPLITFGDLVQVLAPNGRTSDGWEHAPPHGEPLTVMNTIHEVEPAYPFKLFLGDVGHDYTG